MQLSIAQSKRPIRRNIVLNIPDTTNVSLGIFEGGRKRIRIRVLKLRKEQKN